MSSRKVCHRCQGLLDRDGSCPVCDHNIHPDFARYHRESADFRCIAMTDPLVHRCIHAGLGPLELIIALSDRYENAMKEVQRRWETASIPTRIVLHPPEGGDET